jgi:hypothetical protein
LGRRLGVLGSQLTAGDWNFISPVRMNLSVSGTGTGFYSAGFDDGVLFASLSADRSIDIYIQRVGIVDRRVELDSELRLTFDPDEVQVSYLGTADAAQKYRHERNENTLRWWWTVIADIPRVNLESKIMLGKVSWHLSTGIEKTWATLRTDLKALGSRSIPTIRISGDTVSGSSFDAHTGVFFDDAFSVSEVYSPSPENTVAVRIRPDPHISAGRHDFLLKLEPVNYPAVRITSDTYVDFVITRDKPSYLRLGFLQEEVELEARLLCDGNCNRDSDRLELPVVLEHPEWIDLSEFGGVIRLDSIVLDGEEHSIGCTPYSFAASDGTEVPVGCEDGYPTFAVQMTRGLLGTLSIDRTAFDSAWAVGEYRIFFGLDVGTPLRNEPLPVMTQLADRSTVDHLRFESPTRKRNLALGLILGILLVICGYVLVRFRRFSAIEQRYNIARREIGAVQIELEQHILLLPARLEEQRCRIYSFKEYPDTLIKEVVELGNSLNASLAFGHSIALHIPEVATLEGARTREGTGWMTTVRWYKRSCQPWKAAVAAAYEAASNFIQFEEGFIRVMSEITSSNQALVGYASARLKLRMKLYQWVLSSHLFTVKRFLRRSSGFREQLRRRYAVGQFWLSGLDDQRQQDAFPGLYGKLVNYRITRMSRTHFIQPLNRVTTLLAHTCSGRVYFRYRSVALLVRIIDKIRPAG